LEPIEISIYIYYTIEYPILAEKYPILAEKYPILAEKYPILAEKYPILAENMYFQSIFYLIYTDNCGIISFVIKLKGK